MMGGTLTLISSTVSGNTAVGVVVASTMIGDVDPHQQHRLRESGFTLVEVASPMMVGRSG